MKYVTRPRSAQWDELQETPMLEGRTVHDREPVDTGILDQDGQSIFRVMSPIGFIEMRER